ncbi:unnamed protein product [Clonostachys solani]|uniref:Uncharacterized protein n=1 Tax=Clonostachys solani TaxID=160281 RepID=A0A9N9Z3F2_9HYPO|nr:unnamed protein product [Clonostachys solani]
MGRGQVLPDPIPSIPPGKSIISLPAELSSIRRSPDPNSIDGSNWFDPTLLDNEFGTAEGIKELQTIAKYFSVPRVEDDLHVFLNAMNLRLPRSCGWIWPLLSQFDKNAGKDVAVFLLWCPIHLTRLDEPGECFTNDFIAGLQTLLSPPWPRFTLGRFTKTMPPLNR